MNTVLKSVFLGVHLANLNPKRMAALQSVFFGTDPKRDDLPTPSFKQTKTVKVNTALKSVLLGVIPGKPKP